MSGRVLIEGQRLYDLKLFQHSIGEIRVKRILKTYKFYVIKLPFITVNYNRNICEIKAINQNYYTHMCTYNYFQSIAD